MAYNELVCSTNVGNTGLQDCVENFGTDEMLILVPDSTTIATKVLAETEATWEALINAAVATRGYPLFIHFNAEFEQEGEVDEEGWAGKSEFLRDGKLKAKYMAKNISFYNHKELRKHNNRTNLAVYKVTSQGYIKGWTDSSGAILYPFPLSKFRVNYRNDNDGSVLDRTSYSIEEKDGNKWNDNGAWVKPTDFDPLLLEGIKDCTITGTLAATAETVTVRGASDLVGVVGLVSANFSLVDDSAPTVLIAVTVDTDNGDGTYDLTHASITGAHTMTLINQPIGTAGFEAIDEINTTV